VKYLPHITDQASWASLAPMKYLHQISSRLVTAVAGNWRTTNARVEQRVVKETNQFHPIFLNLLNLLNLLTPFQPTSTISTHFNHFASAPLRPLPEAAPVRRPFVGHPLPRLDRLGTAVAGSYASQTAVFCNVTKNKRALALFQIICTIP